MMLVYGVAMIKRFIIILPFLLLASFIAGTQYFAHHVRMAAITPGVTPSITPGVTLGKAGAHEPGKTGIVVATGLDGRVAAGVHLLAKGHATRLLISGAGEGVRLSDIERIVTGSADTITGLDALLGCCIDLGYDAIDTEGNAREAKDWAATHELNQIIVVTSDFHMPRAVIAFQKQFDDADLRQYPVQTPWLTLDENGFSTWWHTPERITLIMGEMVKYLARRITSL